MWLAGSLTTSATSYKWQDVVHLVPRESGKAAGEHKQHKQGRDNNCGPDWIQQGRKPGRPLAKKETTGRKYGFRLENRSQ